MAPAEAPHASRERSPPRSFTFPPVAEPRDDSCQPDSGSDGEDDATEHEASGELSQEDVENWLLVDVRSRCEDLRSTHADGQVLSEEMMQSLLSDAAAVFYAHVQAGPSRQTALRSVRAKQNSAKAAVLKALPNMLLERGMKLGKKAVNTSPSPSKEASQIGLSKYEVERKRNMRANLSMLRSLGLA